MAEGVSGMAMGTPEEKPLSVPVYWEDAKQELMKRDRIMRRIIPMFGDLHLVGRGDPFTTLARSIVGQQISVKAAATVWPCPPTARRCLWCRGP